MYIPQVLGDNGAGAYSNLIAGLQWVANDVAAHNNAPSVAVLSLGGPTSKALNDAINTLVDKNVAIAVAAGNEFGADACTVSPASAQKAVTTGATDRQDRRAPFSNVGSCLDIWAPGQDIVSAGINNDESSRTYSGTSMAAPLVAGAMALIREENPEATPQEVVDLLLSNARRGNFATGSTRKFLQTSYRDVEIPKRIERVKTRKP
jgi:subtilisin family serine protease